VLALEPLAFRTVFTMREFARLGAGQPPLAAVSEADLRARIAGVAGRRGQVPPAANGADDIADPYGRGELAAETVGGDIVTALRGVVAALGLPGPA